MDNLAVSMQGITKIFNGVKANDNVDFNLRKGSIHGLLGENGAGKTTLMNILYGLYQQEAGDIYINGSKEEINSSSNALKPANVIIFFFVSAIIKYPFYNYYSIFHLNCSVILKMFILQAGSIFCNPPYSITAELSILSSIHPCIISY